MKKTCIGLFIFLLSVCRCTEKKSIVTADKNIRDIIVFASQKNEISLSNVKNIKDADSIKAVVDALNNNVITPELFPPHYVIKISYKNGNSATIVCYKNSIKLNGKTAKMKVTIEDIIK